MATEIDKGVGSDGAEVDRSPLPWHLEPSTEHHGPYIVSHWGLNVCDFYMMSEPSAASVRNGGPSRPIKFVDADGNAALVVRAVNAHAELVALWDAAKEWRRISHSEDQSFLKYEARKAALASLDAALAKLDAAGG